MRVGLEPLDQHQIDRRQHLQQVFQAGFRRAAMFVDQCPAFGAGYEHFARARLAVGVAVLAGLVDIEVMVGVLDGRHGDAGLAEGGQQISHQGRLAAAAPPRQAEQPGPRRASRPVPAAGPCA